MNAREAMRHARYLVGSWGRTTMEGGAALCCPTCDDTMLADPEAPTPTDLEFAAGAVDDREECPDCRRIANAIEDLCYRLEDSGALHGKQPDRG